MPEWSQDAPGEPAALVLGWLLGFQGDVSSFPAVIKALISSSSQCKGILLSLNTGECCVHSENLKEKSDEGLGKLQRLRE